MANYAFYSPVSKLVLALDMLLGRLEIFPIIMLFSPSIWRGK
jgi:trk system potassium uptake protein TrkH